MHDYRTKRRYKQEKLERSGYYHRRRQRRRERIRAAQSQATDVVPTFEQIFHSENLIRIYDKLRHSAGRAPGLDRVTYTMLGRREVGQIMRDLSQQIMAGDYEPSRYRIVNIQKKNGSGHRTLKLRSIIYRVSAAALADALGPYFDRLFLPGSHGFRHGLGTQTMLLEMERIITEQERFVIAQDDIRNAFDNVPINYLMQLFRGHIDDERLPINVNKLLHGHRSEYRTMGIDQGSGFSPLALNVALHHALDIPFSETAENPPWLRYADNLVYLC